MVDMKDAHILEAQCQKCGEIFNPLDIDDLEHTVDMDGEECGGDGILLGGYFLSQPDPFGGSETEKDND